MSLEYVASGDVPRALTLVSFGLGRTRDELHFFATRIIVIYVFCTLLKHTNKEEVHREIGPHISTSRSSTHAFYIGP